MNTDIPEQNPILPDKDTPESALARAGMDSILNNLHAAR